MCTSELIGHGHHVQCKPYSESDNFARYSSMDSNTYSENVARVNFGALKDVHANFGKNIKFVVGGNLQHFNLFLFHNWSKLSILSICPKTNILHEPKIPKYYF